MGLVPDRYVVELWGAGLKMHPQQKWPVYIADSSRWVRLPAGVAAQGGGGRDRALIDG